MRDTDELIRQLSTAVQPVSAHALTQRLLIGLSLGVVAALLLLSVSVGVRHDFDAAVRTLPFWTKWLYVGALAAVGFACCLRLARPGLHVGKVPLLFIVPLALLGLRAVYELQQASDVPTAKLWLGHSALVCPWNITAFAVPVFVGVIWAMRRLAPTRLRLAGFTAGCLSGASGAVVYALYCNESAAPFVLTWYSLGVLIPGFIGALLGPRLLRW